MSRPLTRFLFRLTLVSALTLLPWGLAGEARESSPASRFTPIPPCAPLAAVAVAKKIPLEPIDSPSDADSLKPGDSLAALVTFREKGDRRTQWLLHLQVVPLDPGEQPEKSPDPLVIYSTVGNKLEFTSSPAFVNLRTLGPFAEPDTKRRPAKTQDKSARFALNQDFLGLGLNRAASVVLRLKESKPTHVDGWFSFAGMPFSDVEVKAGRELAEAVKLTKEEERALAGSGPALFSYFDIVQRTSGLEEILFKILDMPSVWSMLRRGGVRASFRIQSKHIALAAASSWGLPVEQPVYHVPVVLELNNQPALNITLVVTTPQPPLLACGGIVGLLAELPGDKESFLSLRVVSARRSTNRP